MLIWLGVIAIESTSYFSSVNTETVLYALLVKVFGPISLIHFEAIHAVGRKIGHFVGYGVLTLLLFRAWRGTKTGNGAGLWLASSAWLGIVGAVLVASADEFHQSFLPMRGGSAYDVLLDTAGGACFLLLAYLWIMSRSDRVGPEAEQQHG